MKNNDENKRVKEIAIKILRIVRDNLNDINPKPDSRITNEIKELIDKGGVEDIDN